MDLGKYLCPSRAGKERLPRRNQGGRASRALGAQARGPPRGAAPQRGRQVALSVRAGAPPPAAAGRTHRGRASPARRRSCPGPRRGRRATRAAGRRGACVARARRGPRSWPPPLPRPWLGCRTPGPIEVGMLSPGLSRPGRFRCTTAEILSLRRQPREQNQPSPGPARGVPHMTQSAAPQRIPC